MVAADDARGVATVQRAGFIDLGVLKGNIGDQNYNLGSDLDLAKYRAVSIWCKRFSVNFGAAALRPTEASHQSRANGCLISAKKALSFFPTCLRMDFRSR